MFVRYSVALSILPSSARIIHLCLHGRKMITHQCGAKAHDLGMGARRLHCMAGWLRFEASIDLGL